MLEEQHVRSLNNKSGEMCNSCLLLLKYCYNSFSVFLWELMKEEEMFFFQVDSF